MHGKPLNNRRVGRLRVSNRKGLIWLKYDMYMCEIAR
jgi:hypothetical protein